MKSKGIRISDKEGNHVIVKFSDILEEIQDGSLFYWSILDLYASGNLGEGKSIPVFQKQIYDELRGIFITWKELISLSKKIYIMDLLVIGCKNENLLNRYENDQEMYETCDIVIEMIDSGYWQIFSKDENLINRLAKKFKKIEFLDSDFQKNYLQKE